MDGEGRGGTDCDGKAGEVCKRNRRCAVSLHSRHRAETRKADATLLQMILCGPQFLIGAFVLTGVIWPEGCHIGFDGDKLQCFSEAEVKQATLVLSPPCERRPSRQSEQPEALALAASRATALPALAALQLCRLALEGAGPAVR